MYEMYEMYKMYKMYKKGIKKYNLDGKYPNQFSFQ